MEIIDEVFVLKRSIINCLSNESAWAQGLKTRTMLFAVVLICLAFSLAATLASYYFYTMPFIVDATFVYRGWPFCWLVESWSGWSPPERPHIFQFQPLNFLIDVAFWAVVFQLPTLIFLIEQRNRKSFNAYT
jgi:hypothetical protein